MTPLPPRDVLLRIQQLAGLPKEIRENQWAVSITRLTVMKSLCREPDLAKRFVAYLARRTFEHLIEENNRSVNNATATELSHRGMMEETLKRISAWQKCPTEKLSRLMSDLLGQLRAEQNEHQKIPFGAVRLITDWKLLMFEYAVECHLARDQVVGQWAYMSARLYTERYAGSKGTGLISTSIPFVQDIIDFWMAEYSLTPESLTPKRNTGKASESPPLGRGNQKSNNDVTFTPRQGQFLAFIHLYQKLHRQGPAETDLTSFFQITPPSVHAMIVRLEALKFITRKAGVPRSMRVAIRANRLPKLEAVAGPPW